MFCLKPFYFNDFNLKLMKYLTVMFVQNSEIELPQKTQLVAFATPVRNVLCKNLVVVNQISDKSPLRIVTLLLHSNKLTIH